MVKKICAIAITSLALVACDGGRNQTAGTLIGGAGGAVLGAAIGDSGTAAALGGLSGALVGSHIGAGMDRRDAYEDRHYHRHGGRW